jgi:hypothetical protein
MMSYTRNAVLLFAILAGVLGLLTLFVALLAIASNANPTTGLYADAGVGGAFLAFSFALIAILELYGGGEPEVPPAPPPVIFGAPLPPPPPPP